MCGGKHESPTGLNKAQHELLVTPILNTLTRRLPGQRDTDPLGLSRRPPRLGATKSLAAASDDVLLPVRIPRTHLSRYKLAHNSRTTVRTDNSPGRTFTYRCDIHRLFSLYSIGFGGTARETARRARGLDMVVLANDPLIADDDPVGVQHETGSRDLEDLLGESDVVSLHVPLLPATRHLIGANTVQRMKPGAYLVNAARGGIVDEHALVDALRSGRLGGARLDVFETEPLPADSVLVGAPNLIVTPHIAGVTEEANERISTTTVRNVARALRQRTRLDR